MPNEVATWLLRSKTSAGPAIEPVTIGAVKNAVGLWGDDFDGQIAGYIKSARERVEAETGKHLLSQDVTLGIVAFPYDCPLDLGMFPVQELVSINYTDSNGDAKTADVADFELVPVQSTIVMQPLIGKAWPTDAAVRLGAVSITVKAGYGDTRDSVPSDLRDAVLLDAQQRWWGEREGTGIQIVNAEEAISRIIDRYRHRAGSN